MWWLFVVSALIEVAAGGISLFSPSSIPSFSKVKKEKRDPGVHPKIKINNTSIIN
jgi:hypothetical protein